MFFSLRRKMLINASGCEIIFGRDEGTGTKVRYLQLPVSGAPLDAYRNPR